MPGRRMCLVFIAVAASVAAGAASQPSAGLPTVPASSTAAVAVADHSTPDKTWATLCAAVRAGNLAGFRACFANRNEVSKVFMDAYSDLTVTAFQLATASADLGEDGKKLSARLASTYTDIVQNGENRKTEITGDTARWIKTVTTAAGPTEQVMYFKSVKGEWLIDTSESYGLNSAAGRKNAEDFIETSSAQVKIFKQVIADIKSKKITSVDQMRASLDGSGGK